FFQAEDGIRDGHVTGVQTCALPISWFREEDLEPTTGAMMKTVRALSREQLASVVRQIQEILYLDEDGNGEFWNPEKKWDAETLEYVVAVLDDYGLTPAEAIRCEPIHSADKRAESP